MKVAIASGKGGTGKTTVATNLAHVAARAGTAVAYLDCDVEEPNGHIFLKPDIAETQPVSRPVPRVDAGKCTACGQCGEICQYSAIVCIGQQVLVNPEMCHACGGCALVCPVGAITEQPREIGTLRLGSAGGIRFVSGTLNVGETMSPPVIRQVKAAQPQAELVILDAPPGTSCPVVETIRGADFVLLVTEPTPFGLNDLQLAVEMVRALKRPFAVVINRADIGDGQTRRYCDLQRIGVLAEIPDDRQLAEAYSRGEMACEAKPELRGLFSELLRRITKAVS
ncbi:MAG TPA: ATP-binding protein [Phycisphaerae bacterium]|nr:ATP-binding protein [Phycisphaerae bacterium]HUT57357.1 ATP-binding protein [Phycisphaerae bacterium]